MANYTQYIPQINSTTYPTSISNCFTALTADVTALETDKAPLADPVFTGTPNVSGSTIWHAGNDGVGSGLDADLLDGLSSTSFLRTDVDDTYTGSTLTLDSSAVLRLDNTSNLSLVSTLHAFQIGASASDNLAIDGNEIMARNNGATSILMLNNSGGVVNINGSLAWHAGNDGTGSGLDADLLDGVEGTSYALLASPTLTGNPTAPTQTADDNSTKVATTEYVETAVELGAATFGNSGYPNISSSVFSANIDIPLATWETVGPTGSGADNIWTGLDTVPLSATWIEIMIIIYVTSDGINGSTTAIYAVSNIITSPATTNSSKIGQGYGSKGGPIGFNTFNTKIPVDSNNIFKMAYTEDIAPVSRSISIYIQGYNA